MVAYKIICSLAAIAAMQGTCNSRRDSVTRIPEFKKITTSRYEGATKFPYVASQEKQNRILTSFSDLKTGLEVSTTVKLLGPPDFVQTRSRKRTPEIQGYLCMYYLYGGGEVSTSQRWDVVLELYFDRAGKLEEVYPASKEVLTSRLSKSLREKGTGSKP